MHLTLSRMRNQWHRLRTRGMELHPLAQGNLLSLESLPLDRPAREARYVVLDLETTGMDHHRDRVVSVGAFRLVNGRVKLGEVFSEMINPGRDIPSESIKVHGIVPDMIRHARMAWEVFSDLLEFIGSDILVAHYAVLDLHFLNRVMRTQYGIPLQNMVLDTVRLCRHLLLEPSPYGVYTNFRLCSLDHLAQRFGIDVPERHTALGDALATALIFQRFLLMMEKRKEGSLRYLIKSAALR